jgi:hypothetical protein
MNRKTGQTLKSQKKAAKANTYVVKLAKELTMGIFVLSMCVHVNDIEWWKTHNLSSHILTKTLKCHTKRRNKNCRQRKSLKGDGNEEK